ncbi:MAG: sugar ABC transporter permease [Treponema sp.]|nr:sugar ABC transporter permease [Treponema sp.]
MKVIFPHNRGKQNLRFHNLMLPYYFLSPAAILFMIFLLYPIINVFYYSFQNYNPGAFYGNGFAGVDNFVTIFTTDKRFVQALIISIRWVFTQISLQLLCGLIIALLLNQHFFGRAVVRSIIISPWALSGVLVSILWALLYNEHIGPINDILMRLSIIKRPVAWLANLDTVFHAAALAELWRGIPLFAIALLAALQSVPDELYESCAMDGGGVFWKFFFVTLPYLKDTIILTTLLRAVWEFNGVDLIMNLTGGGPMNSTTTLSLYIANLAIKSQQFGYGSAVAVIAFFFLLIFAVLYLRLSKFGETSL